jgi:urease accessory protein
MRPNISSKQSDAGHGPYRLLLSVGLPFLLLLAFLSQQFFSFDNLGWSHGFSHPLMGWDHLVTMLAVGVWAAQLRGQAVWMLPLAFVGVMSLGGLAGAAGISIPSVEGIILLSCAVFSVLITRKIRFSAKINVMIVAFFAFFHGFAHGQEISTSASLISYTLGFMLATLLLHGAGILVSKLVVLAVTCLLAAMFSSSALAKYAATQEQKIPVSSTKIMFDGRGLFDFGGLNQATQPAFQSDSVIGINCLESFRLSFSERGKFASINVSNKASSTKLKLVADFSALIFKTSSVIALNDRQMLSLRADDYCAPGDLSFKKHYPAINHTPGTHLLSNGVGLTSPPVANDDLNAQSAKTNFCKKNPSVIEDKRLQLTFASFDIGIIPHLHPSNDSLLDSFHALVIASVFQKAATLRQLYFVGYLALTYPVLSTDDYIGLAPTNKPNLDTRPDKFEFVSQVFASALDEMQFEIPPPYYLNAEIGIESVYSSDT